VEFLNTSHPDVLAWRRGNVVAVVNFADYDVEAAIEDLEAGSYEQWLNSQTVYGGPSVTTLSLEASPSIPMETKGYAVYVKQ
jgi:hypothetical protein